MDKLEIIIYKKKILNDFKNSVNLKRKKYIELSKKNTRKYITIDTEKNKEEIKMHKM